MDVIQKAHELANAIQESKELGRLREIEVKILNEISSEEEKSLIYREYTTALHEFTNLLEAVQFILTSSYDGKLDSAKNCGRCCKNH